MGRVRAEERRPDRHAFRERIARLRLEPDDPWNEDPIGCILLAEPFFFDREDWIAGPADWAASTQRGKGYDLSDGIGARLWADVQARLEAMRVGDRWRERAPDDDFLEPPEILDGHAPTSPGRRWIGQGIFQSLIVDAYGRQCAVTRERALPALDAAHIRSFSERPEHDVRNGLLLRSNVHRLFDAGYVTVTPQYKVEVSHRVREDFNDGENHLKMHGAEIVVPEREAWRPDREALAWHNERWFRG